MSYCPWCNLFYSEIGHECAGKPASPFGVPAMPIHYSPLGGIPVCWYGKIHHECTVGLSLPPRNDNPKIVTCLSCLKWLKENPPVENTPQAQIKPPEQKAAPAPTEQPKVADSAPQAIYQGFTHEQRDRIGRAYYEGYAAYDARRRNWQLSSIVPWEALDVLVKEDYRQLAEGVINACCEALQQAARQDAEWSPSNMEIKPGDKVCVIGCPGQTFHVRQVLITEGFVFQYELVWWSGGNRNQAWFMACEVEPHKDEQGHMGLRKEG